MATTIRKATAIQLVRDNSTANVRRAAAVAYTSDVGENLRQIVGYAFETIPGSEVVRSIAGYAFENAPRTIPMSKTGDLSMYDLINNNRIVSTVFSTSNTTLGTPTALSQLDTNGHNTSVSLTAKNGSGYSGSITFYYLRRPIGDLNPTSLSLGTISVDTTIYAVLATINSKYSWNLSQSDVVDGIVKAGAQGITLTAASGSYLFVPGSQVIVGLHTALSSAVATTALTGFQNASGGI